MQTDLPCVGDFQAAWNPDMNGTICSTTYITKYGNKSGNLVISVVS